ncbi:MAG TPA: hypothetical protein VH765_13550 [Xanthobacteraceae bacterium]|jgi:hypothetical protein
MKATLIGLSAALGLGLLASTPASATYVYGSYGYSPSYHYSHYDRGHHYGYYKRHKHRGFTVVVKRHKPYYHSYRYDHGPYGYYRW